MGRRSVYWQFVSPALVAGTCLLAATAGASPQTVRDELTGIDFVDVPGACFFLGVEQHGEMTPDGVLLPPRRDEMPRHEVCIDGFQLARTETSVAQWGRLMPEAPHHAPADHPVSGVTLEEIELFVRRLNERTKGAHYRLPTEAEWEFACRGDDPQPAAGDPAWRSAEEVRRVAFYLDDGRLNVAPLPVGSLAANRFGLFDMLGNVWEWTSDNFAADAYAEHARKNPRHAEPTGRRVIRGGSWKTGEFEVRCGTRGWGVAGDRLPTLGFRLVRVKTGK